MIYISIRTYGTLEKNLILFEQKNCKVCLQDISKSYEKTKSFQWQLQKTALQSLCNCSIHDLEFFLSNISEDNIVLSLPKMCETKPHRFLNKLSDLAKLHGGHFENSLAIEQLVFKSTNHSS